MDSDTQRPDVTTNGLDAGWSAGDGWGFVPDDDGFYPAHRDCCFGCGPANHIGLGLRIRDGAAGDLVCDYSFDDRFAGGPGVAHGGAVAAVLDDVIGAVSLAHGVPRVTARIEVDYRSPIARGQDVTIRARLVAVAGRKATVAGEMRDARGRILAEATAIMVEIDDWRVT